MVSDASQGDSPVDEALAIYFESVDREEPVSISRLIAAFPQHQAELQRFFATERRLHDECQNLAAVATDTLAAPIAIGRFVVERTLGAGAFGIVYLAFDGQLKRHVAVKVPLPQAIGDEASRRRFEAEAAAAARLDHEGIVAVYEADFSGPVPYIASAYCPGPDLGKWLAERDKPVPWAEAATFMAKLGEAVQFAHESGVYHRDLKPSNVMLMPGEKTTGESLGEFVPKLTDFGLAKCALLGDTQTRSSILIGTPLYMAPEQLESARIEFPVLADIYSLGCMLYELVASTVPIHGENYVTMLDRLREAKPIPLRQLAPEAPADLERVCHKCLEKNPQARYSSAAEFAEDLRACVEGRPIQAAQASWLTRFRYWSTRPQRVFDAGWYTLCVQLLLGIWTGVSLAAGGVVLQIPADEMAQMFAEFFALVLLVNLPMAIVGWYTMRRKAWAVHAGLVLSAVNIVVPVIFVSLSNPPLFADLYARVAASGYFALTTCILVLMAEVGQLFLYFVAWAAQKSEFTRAR